MLEYKSIKTKNGECGYTSLGTGAPLIMVVGYSGTLFHWHGKFVHELACHYTVYLVDNRKIGLSDSDNECSMTGLAKDIADFIDAMSLHKPYILGWSMGGVVIQELLKHYPDKVKSAILLATVPTMMDNNPKFYEFVSRAGEMPAEEYRRGIYHFFFSHDSHENTKDELTSSALKFKNYTYRFESSARDFQHELIRNWAGSSAYDLAKVQVPVLVVWAKNDLVVTQRAALFLADHLVSAKLIIYSSGGHFLLQENHTNIADDIINFINYQV